jgi:hypothetical protein
MIVHLIAEDFKNLAHRSMYSLFLTVIPSRFQSLKAEDQRLNYSYIEKLASYLPFTE